MPRAGRSAKWTARGMKPLPQFLTTHHPICGLPVFADSPAVGWFLMRISPFMILRWSYLFLSLLFLAVGLLTVFPAPDWSEWRLAVLAGEYGYMLALVPLFVAALAWLSRGRQLLLTAGTLLVCALALGLLLKPGVEAVQVSRQLPARLTAAFGPGEIQREPFSLREIFARGTNPVAVETRSFAAGLALDYYRPAGFAGRLVACVVTIHGGGWDSGDRTQFAFFNHWLASLGYGVAAVSYRLAPDAIWPAQREDVLAALAYLKSHAAELGIDSNRLVLLGRSAGGQIAEVVGYGARDPAIRGVIGMYSPSDLNFGYEHAWEDDAIRSPSLMRQYLGGPPEKAQANYDSASALPQVTRGAPPTLQLHGRLDTLVWHRHSERLAARLDELGVSNVFVSLPWATHAFDVNPRGPGGQITRHAVEWFLAAVTR